MTLEKQNEDGSTEIVPDLLQPRVFAPGEKLVEAGVPEGFAAKPTLPGLTEGRIVHFVLPNGDHRAALVVNAWDGGIGSDHLANLRVFADGTNDLEAFDLTVGSYRDEIKATGTFWATSMPFDNVTKRPFSYHWIEPK